jgi:hypothetical protein
MLGLQVFTFMNTRIVYHDHRPLRYRLTKVIDTIDHNITVDHAFKAISWKPILAVHKSQHGELIINRESTDLKNILKL